VIYTPGPWKVSEERSAFRSDLPRFAEVFGHDIQAATGETVAAVDVRFVPGLDEYGEDGYANARLIAAAPELLETLEDTVQVFEGLDRAAELHEELYPVLANLRAAIAKATEQSHEELRR
jgi:hypothetical protein